MTAAQEKFELGPIQKEWLRRLRAHPERQMRAKLGKVEDLERGEYKACCLGEAVLMLCAYDEQMPTIAAGNLLDGDAAILPTDATRERLGLRSSDGSLKNNFIKEYMTCYCLAHMNDSGMTWPEIADYIEANPENVFTKSV